ncbi:MAG TPA: sialidase family protein [Nitrososphaeraceae archaeon]|nr:sialidase family protein [Nitrososphaeraceae archaeon]
MMKKTLTSLKLAVMLLAVNIIVSVVSFTIYTNNQQVYAQSIDDANTNDDDDDNNNSLSFTEPINLTNNTRDSVYAQIASYGNNVYMVWQENNSDPSDHNSNVNNNIQYNNDNYRNYDIYIKKSTDGGSTFSKEINLSKNPGFSEHPQIAISGNNVYVAWIDDASFSSSTTKNQEIYFRKSIDGGNTFDKIINLSNSSNADSYNLEITAAGNNVYAVWQETTLPNAYAYDTSSSGSGVNADNNSDRSSISSKENSSILFRASTDDGNTFKMIKSLSNNAFKSYPKIAAFENSAYVVWNVGIIGDSNREDNDANNINNGIFFTKSFDSGNSFSDTIKLNSNRNSIGESQIAAYGNNVYVVWGGNPDEKVVGNIFFVKSTDNGNRFAKAVSLGEENSLNVEIIAGGNNNVYVAWQALLSADNICPSCLLKPDDNDEILFKMSSDNGATFTDITENISKNKGISECTSIAVSENNNVYVAWEDYTYGNHEILFSKSL